MRMGHIESSPAEILPPVKPGAPRPRPAPESAIQLGLIGADKRLTLILNCAAQVGLRRAEIAVIHRSDLVQDYDGWSLIVHGKGNRERIEPLSQGLAIALREACLAGGGWAFPGDINGHISASYVGKLAARALPGEWTLHTLRHRFATKAYKASGGDLIAVQQLLGHASVATTQRYIKLDDGRLREVAALAA